MELSIEQSPVFLPRSSRFVISCDLGQSMDPTAIAVLEKKTGVVDFRSEHDRHCNIAGPPQKPAERIEVRHLERLPLGMTYPNIVAHVGSLLARAPLCGVPGNLNVSPAAELVIDETGVGRAVGDIFNDHGLKPIRVTITAGAEVTPQGNKRWNVAKLILISKVDALLHTGDLKFAAELAESETMKNELKDFRRKLSETGKATFAARASRHDDLLLAVSLGAWWITRPPPAVAQFGRYGYADPGSGNTFVIGKES